MHKVSNEEILKTVVIALPEPRIVNTIFSHVVIIITQCTYYIV